MIPDPVLAKAAITIVTLTLKNESLQGAVRRKIGFDPLQRAVAAALKAAVTELETDYPEWVAALFDESFLTKEAAPVFAAVVTRGRDASATELARRYVKSLGPSRTAQQSVRRTERVAGVALAAYTAEIRRHDTYRSFAYFPRRTRRT